MASNRLQEFSQYAELKQLAFSMALLQRQKGFHSLAVLSFFPGEGKTLFCAAAAMAYADVSRGRVLVIDATTRQNNGSLVLRECFNPPVSNVEILTMDEIRSGVVRISDTKYAQAVSESPAVHNLEIVDNVPSDAIKNHEQDFSLLRSVTETEGKSHDLVLLDTAPMNSKNRANIDPLVVARQADASILIVGQKLLQAGELNAYLKIARDPTIRLIGVVANEDFVS